MKIVLKPNRIVLCFAAVFAVGGLLLGIPEMFIGLVLGYFIGCLCSQIIFNRAVCKYLENPGTSSFYEGEAGLAAVCALGVYILSKAPPKLLAEETIITRVSSRAAGKFKGGEKTVALAESFSHLAFDRLSVLNPDLLCESLLARRYQTGDLPMLGMELASMAIGKDAEEEALHIRQFLDPMYQPPLSDNAENDPWTVLGISYGASSDEVKSAFRKLALMFHPDNQAGLSAEEQKTMSETFMKIREAYRVIIREITGSTP